MTTGTFADHAERRSKARLGAGDWIGLAAAPTFAVIALVTGLSDSGLRDALCGAALNAGLGTGSFGGMAFMYLLMSVFHTAPWLRLVARWRNGD